MKLLNSLISLIRLSDDIVSGLIVHFSETDFKDLPIVGGEFRSTSPNQIDATYGLYIGVGKSATIKSVSLKQPIQVNLGTTLVIK